jgi:hypothetical protein
MFYKKKKAKQLEERSSIVNLDSQCTSVPDDPFISNGASPSEQSSHHLQTSNIRPPSEYSSVSGPTRNDSSPVDPSFQPQFYPQNRPQQYFCQYPNPQYDYSNPAYFVPEHEQNQKG